MKPLEAAQKNGWAYRSMNFTIGEKAQYYRKDGQYIEVLYAKDGSRRVLNAMCVPDLQFPEDWKPVPDPKNIERILLMIQDAPPIRKGRLADILTPGLAASIRWPSKDQWTGIMYWDGEQFSDEIKVDRVILFKDDWEIVKEYPCS